MIPTVQATTRLAARCQPQPRLDVFALGTFRTMLAASRLYLVAFAEGQRLNPGACFLKTSLCFRPAAGPAA